LHGCDQQGERSAMTQNASIVAGENRPSERQMTRDEIIAFFERRQVAYDNLGVTALAADYFRSLVAIQPTPKTSSERIAESCAAINIIVIIMKLWNCRFSVIKSKEIIELTAHRSFP
jgi:hypothetical protein